MTSGVVLDASALLAMIREEPGGELVAGAIARARMSAVNFAEVVSYLSHADVPSTEIEEMLTPLPLVVIDADLELAWMAGRLRKKTAAAGLSLGDRFCLALAARDRLPAWTADRQWRAISGQIDAEIVIIR
jgi:PIN domain nuclease of toxin-antitoxin system